MKDDQGRAILDQLNWEKSQFAPKEQAVVERFLIKYHRTFDRQRLDITINNKFKNNLTPKHDKPVYPQILPTPTHLKDEI